MTLKIEYFFCEAFDTAPNNSENSLHSLMAYERDNAYTWIKYFKQQKPYKYRESEQKGA